MMSFVVNLQAGPGINIIFTMPALNTANSTIFNFMLKQLYIMGANAHIMQITKICMKYKYVKFV